MSKYSIMSYNDGYNRTTKAEQYSLVRVTSLYPSSAGGPWSCFYPPVVVNITVQTLFQVLASDSF